MYAGNVSDLVAQLALGGYRHAYIDGGSTITSFLNQQLVNEITITRVPVILGGGVPLFGELRKRVSLRHAFTSVFPNDYIQTKYVIGYA
ncbi:dihydrofolate reductase family protein [Vibrio gallicus]|uniref:dihydrofolate reductase family protein n=1 Tax=Vibrio gallicus TaxID=190897 RepID=UPI0021C3689D|nr:dihydrofolate reductase family protein [Vibrio gallicus]